MNDGPRTRGRWQQTVLEVILLVVAIGSIVFAVVETLDVMTTDRLEVGVTLEDDAVELGSLDGYAVETGDATLAISGPSTGQRLTALVPTLAGAFVVGTAATLLWEVLRSVRAGDPFHRGNATKLRTIAAVTAIGGTTASVLAGLSSLWLSGDAPDELGVAVGGSISFVPLALGLVIGVVAEVFRRGAELRDEVEGLV